MSAENTKYQKVDSTKISPNPRAPYPNIRIFISPAHSFSSFSMFAEAGHLGIEFFLGKACHFTSPCPYLGPGVCSGRGVDSIQDFSPPQRPSASQMLLNQGLDLNRFSASRGSIKKSSVGVDFPLQRLSLGDFASDKAGESGREGPKESGEGEGESGSRTQLYL